MYWASRTARFRSILHPWAPLTKLTRPPRAASWIFCAVYFFHPQWSEVVRLIAAQQTPPIAESLLNCILDDPDPIGRFLKRGPLLALRCLSDGTTVPNRRLVTGILNSLRDLGRSKWLGVTLEAFDVLKNLAGTRHEQLAKETISAILETAKVELDSKQYSCLYERAHLSSVLEKTESQLGPSFESEAAREVVVAIEGNPCLVVYLNVGFACKESRGLVSKCLLSGAKRRNRRSIQGNPRTRNRTPSRH